MIACRKASVPGALYLSVELLAALVVCPLSFFSFQRKYRRAGQDTLRTSVPQIDDELAESLRVLAELEARLPAIRTQASQVQLVYDSGRRKVRNYDNHFLPKRKKKSKAPPFSVCCAYRPKRSRKISDG